MCTYNHSKQLCYIRHSRLPHSNLDVEPCRLPHSKKLCYIRHSRLLSRNHKFRLNRVHFDGSTKERNPPLKLSGFDIFMQVENINVTPKRNTFGW